MLFIVECPECLGIVGGKVEEPDDKIQCSICGKLIDGKNGKWINEPIEEVKDFDLLSID